MVEVRQEDYATAKAANLVWASAIGGPSVSVIAAAIARIAAENAAQEEITALRARIAELEACIDLVIPDDCKSQLHEDATNMVKLQARVAELEAERAEWVEVERLRMGKV